MKDQISINITPKSVFLVLVTVLLVYFSIQISGILFMFILAYILASALKPAALWLEKRKIPKAISSLTVLILFLMVFVLTLSLLFPVLVEQLNALYDNRFDIYESANSLVSGFSVETQDAIYHYVEVFPEKVSQFILSPQLLSNILGVLAGFAGLVLFVVVTAYILIEKSSPMTLIKKYWPKKTRELAVDSFKAFDLKISQWVRGQLILSFAVGTLSYIGLKLLGVPYAELLAVIAAITELIPYIGPWIGGFFAVLIAFTVSPLLAFWTGLLYFGIQQFEAAFLVPRVMKKAVDLSPVATLFIVTAGAALFGVWGAIISIPIVAGSKAAIDVYLRKVDG